MSQLAFVHIERAGGTSVHSYLTTHVPRYVVTSPRALDANEAQSIIRAGEYRGWLRVAGGIGGHSVRHWDWLWPSPPVGMTILRNPIERFLSHYIHQVVHLRIPWTMAEFASQRRHWDWQTVRIVGTRDVDLAWQELKGFDVIGFTSSLNTLLREICTESGCHCPTGVKMNAGVPPQDFYRELERNRELVDEANSLDLELYRRAKQEYGDFRLSQRARESVHWRLRNLPLLPFMTKARSLTIEGPARRLAERGAYSPELARLIVDRSNELSIS